MKNYIFEYFNSPRKPGELSCPMKRTIVCQDGFVITVYAKTYPDGSNAYYGGVWLPDGKVIIPSNATSYEVEYTSEFEELLGGYTDYVPEDVINQIIEKHWGILEGVNPE